jgi:ribosome maturation factor RimP
MSQQRGRRGGSTRAEAGRGRDGPPAPAPLRPPTAEHRERLRAVVEPVVVDAGYDLEDLSLSRVGRRYLVRVAVDSDKGVDLDAVAELARAISHDLDAAEADGDELIAGEYELEVGSRGVDRPLTEPRHWRRNVGRLVRVRVKDRDVTARVTTADADGVTLDVDGLPERVGWADLGPGRVEVELKRLADVPDDEESQMSGHNDESEISDDDDEFDEDDGEDEE